MEALLRGEEEVETFFRQRLGKKKKERENSFFFLSSFSFFLLLFLFFFFQFIPLSRTSSITLAVEGEGGGGERSLIVTQGGRDPAAAGNSGQKNDCQKNVFFFCSPFS